jgi:hypothetical protein
MIWINILYLEVFKNFLSLNFCKFLKYSRDIKMSVTHHRNRKLNFHITLIYKNIMICIIINAIALKIVLSITSKH